MILAFYKSVPFVWLKKHWKSVFDVISLFNLKRLSAPSINFSLLALLNSSYPSIRAAHLPTIFLVSLQLVAGHTALFPQWHLPRSWLKRNIHLRFILELQGWDFLTDRFPLKPLQTKFHKGGIMSWLECAGYHHRQHNLGVQNLGR